MATDVAAYNDRMRIQVNADLLEVLQLIEQTCQVTDSRGLRYYQFGYHSAAGKNLRLVLARGEVER